MRSVDPWAGSSIVMNAFESIRMRRMRAPAFPMIAPANWNQIDNDNCSMYLLYMHQSVGLSLVWEFLFSSSPINYGTYIFWYGDLGRFFRLVALIVIAHIIAKIVSKIVATAKITAQTKYCSIITEIIVESCVTA